MSYNIGVDPKEVKNINPRYKVGRCLDGLVSVGTNRRRRDPQADIILETINDLFCWQTSEGGCWLLENGEPWLLV